MTYHENLLFEHKGLGKVRLELCFSRCGLSAEKLFPWSQFDELSLTLEN